MMVSKTLSKSKGPVSTKRRTHRVTISSDSVDVLDKRRAQRLCILLLIGVAATIVSLGMRLIPRAKYVLEERELTGLGLNQLEHRVRQSPQDAQVLYHYGEALRNRGRSREAVVAFERAAELSPEMARAYTGLGASLGQMRNIAKAEVALRAAQKLDPRDIEPRMALAEVYSKVNRPDLAVAEVQAAVRLEPENSKLWYELSRAHLSRFDRSGALEAMEKAVSLNSARSDYWRELGHLYAFYTRLEDAERCLKRALTIRPNDAVSHLWLGQVYLDRGDRVGDRERAEKSLRECLRLIESQHERPDPRLVADAHIELGKLLRRDRRYKEAELSLRRAVKLAPSREQSSFLLGQVLMSQGKLQEGQRYIDAFQRMSSAKHELASLSERIRLEPNNPSLRPRLRQLYRRLKDAGVQMQGPETLPQPGN